MNGTATLTHRRPVVTSNEPAFITTCRRILENTQSEEFRGILVDSYTASLVTQVFDGISAENRKRYVLIIEVDPARAADIAHALVSKAGK